MSWWRKLLPDPTDALPLEAARLVVVDTETTGLDPERAELLSIGAVAVEQLRVDLSQQFDCVLYSKTDVTNGSVLIHGIGPAALAQGEPPHRVLGEFLRFAENSPLVAFHAGFDRRVLERAVRAHLGARLPNRFLDMAQLAPTLLKAQAPEENSLDAWLERFELQAIERHSAAADALATAELLLIVLHRARRDGLMTIGDLTKRVRLARRLQTMRSPD